MKTCWPRHATPTLRARLAINRTPSVKSEQCDAYCNVRVLCASTTGEGTRTIPSAGEPLIQVFAHGGSYILANHRSCDLRAHLLSPAQRHLTTERSPEWGCRMSRRIICALLLGLSFTVGSLGALPNLPRGSGAANSKVIRHDPAFRVGYMDGYRQGSNDSGSLSNSYKDESGPLYDQALDGYTQQYGDQATYRKLFRQGYIEGYKAGWDFNSGQYNPLGAGHW